LRAPHPSAMSPTSLEQDLACLRTAACRDTPNL
jgi:hypothetical protein